jgi:hypothetical protein
MTGIEDWPVSEPKVSPDGRWRWDGSQWVPNAAPPPPPPHAGQPVQPYQPGHPSTYQYPAYVAAPQATNGMAIASMVLGILWLYWIGSVLALIFGYVALGQIKERNQGGRGMAIAGIVLGWVGVGALLLVIIVAIAAGSDSSSGF